MIYAQISRTAIEVLIYTAKYLNASPADIPEVKFDECCWMEIALRGKDKLLVGCLYRSPNSDAVNTAQLYTSKRHVSQMKKYSHVLICSDFNFPDIDWIENLPPENARSPGYYFREAIRDCYFTQHVNEYTHHRGDQRPSTLDLILTNEDD